MIWIVVLITLSIALAVSVMVGRRNARAGIDWGGSDSIDGQSNSATRPRTLRDQIGVERWSDLLPFGLYVLLTAMVLVLAVVGFFIWRQGALTLLVALGLKGDQLNGAYQVVVWGLGVALFAVFVIAQRSLHVAWVGKRLWQRFAVWAGALGAAIALGWLCSLLIG